MDPALKNVPIIPGFVKLSFDFQPKLALLPVHLSLFSSFLKGLTNDTLRAGGKEMERKRKRLAETGPGELGKRKCGE